MLVVQSSGVEVLKQSGPTTDRPNQATSAVTVKLLNLTNKLCQIVIVVPPRALRGLLTVIQKRRWRCRWQGPGFDSMRTFDGS